MVIDNETFEVIHRMLVDVDFDFPHGLAIDQREDARYLASTYSSVVYAIDTATDTILKKMLTREAHSQYGFADTG